LNQEECIICAVQLRALLLVLLGLAALTSFGAGSGVRNTDERRIKDRSPMYHVWLVTLCRHRSPGRASPLKRYFVLECLKGVARGVEVRLNSEGKGGERRDEIGWGLEFGIESSIAHESEQDSRDSTARTAIQRHDRTC
jgi:hypothetical protein